MIIWTSNDPILKDEGSFGLDADVISTVSTDDAHSWADKITGVNIDFTKDSGEANEIAYSIATDDRGNWLTAWWESLVVEGGFDGDIGYSWSKGGSAWNFAGYINPNYARDPDCRDDQPYVTFGGSYFAISYLTYCAQPSLVTATIAFTGDVGLSWQYFDYIKMMPDIGGTSPFDAALEYFPKSQLFYTAVTSPSGNKQMHRLASGNLRYRFCGVSSYNSHILS